MGEARQLVQELIDAHKAEQRREAVVLIEELLEEYRRRTAEVEMD